MGKETEQLTWFKCELDRGTLKALSRRTDRDGLWHFGIYFSALVAVGAMLVITWGTVWAWPVFFVYSFLWSFGNAAGHEACHGTPFRNQRFNTISIQQSEARKFARQ